jgi:hypothetical protein
MNEKSSEHLRIRKIMASFSIVTLALKIWNNKVTRGQFHQHFTRWIYKGRSQKHKKTDILTVFFGLLGNAHTKAARKMLVKLSPETLIYVIEVTKRHQKCYYWPILTQAPQVLKMTFYQIKQFSWTFHFCLL